MHFELAQHLLAQATQPGASYDPPYFGFGGPTQAMHMFGIRLVGVNVENGFKLLLSLMVIAVALVVSKVGRRLARGSLSRDYNRAGFWARQGISLGVTIVALIGLLSIWFDDPTRLSTALGLVTAGLAFALQRVVTALAGYFLILRGSTFNVGDRIVMGGVRGDVVALGFMQTTIMEMGQPPPVQNADPAMWVKSRQYTGRIVAVSNAKVFDEPVFNYTRDFAYIWEEMSVAIAYRDDHAAVERMLLETARKHTDDLTRIAETEMQRLERLYNMPRADMNPRVYWRMTENWLELSVRFLTKDHGVRDIKDAMSRDIVAGLKTAGIEIASSTIEITGFPPLRRARTRE